MTIYFTASVVGKKYHLSNYLFIIDYLTSKKFRVISDHIIKSSQEEIKLKSKDERIKFQKKLGNWIKKSDFVIAETSFPSISVGYEISLAIKMQKPVLVLYSQGDPPNLFAYSKEENLICEKYSTKALPMIIDDFVKFVKGSSDSKFTFFIPTKIASFLDKVSKEEKLPKSVYLRKLIEKDMS